MAGAANRLAPDRTEKAVGVLSLVMLGFVAAAVLRGGTDWAKLPWQLWFHLATIALLLALTPVLLWQPRGTARHRVLGWVWAVAMGSTALVSFWLRFRGDGRLSAIHLLSAGTLVLVPVAVIAARRHNVRVHRRVVRGLSMGALLVAGFFTFPFHRLLGTWLFG